MKSKILCSFIFLTGLSCSGQNSDVTIRSGKGNDISVMQTGSDTSAKSNIDLAESDSNKIDINQSKQNTAQNKQEPQDGFWSTLTNMQKIVALIAGILALLTSGYTLLSSRKKQKSKKK
jgi:hypothetical protein